MYSTASRSILFHAEKGLKDVAAGVVCIMMKYLSHRFEQDPETNIISKS